MEIGLPEEYQHLLGRPKGRACYNCRPLPPKNLTREELSNELKEREYELPSKYPADSNRRYCTNCTYNINKKV